MLCLAIFAILGLVTAYEPCTGVLPPGLNKLRKGVDITTVDLVPLHISASQGFKGSVFDYTCSMNRQWKNPRNKVSYQIPDEIDNLVNLPGGLMNIHEEVHTTVRSVVKSRASSMGLSYVSGMFSRSESMKEMSNSLTNRSRSIAQVSAFHSVFRADMAPYWFLNIGRYAKTYIDRRLPNTYSENPQAYAEFIRFFGTHYFMHGKFGGLFRDYMEIKTEFFKSIAEKKQVKASVKVSFMKKLNASGGYEGNTRTNATFEANTDHHLKYYGGSANLLGDPKKTWVAWMNSVPSHPWMFGGQLAPITDLIQNSSKRSAMATAIQEHIDRSFLKEVETDYYTLLKKTNDRNVSESIRAKIRQVTSYKDVPIGQIHTIQNKLQALREGLQALREAVARQEHIDRLKEVETDYNTLLKKTNDKNVRERIRAKIRQITAYYKDVPIGQIHTFQNKLKALREGLQALREAVAKQEHIDRNFLKEAEAHCYRLLKKTDDTNVRTRVLAMIQRIKTFKSIAIGRLYTIHNELQALRQGLIIPNWFLHNTKVCYQWYPDGDGGQCGGGADRNLCANINGMTAYYRDDSDRRSGGCRMRWGIQSVGYKTSDSWFSDVELCYQWFADGDGGQCGAGAPKLTCAKVTAFTAWYRDDTDRRSGGCQMRWKLAVPVTAPLWIRMAKLCFESYPDGDGGQCGGGVQRKLCAATNQWTTYYRDDSDRRSGGCRMRWGIVL